MITTPGRQRKYQQRTEETGKEPGVEYGFVDLLKCPDVFLVRKLAKPPCDRALISVKETADHSRKEDRQQEQNLSFHDLYFHLKNHLLWGWSCPVMLCIFLPGCRQYTKIISIFALC